MKVLATEFTRNTLVSVDYDEFNWLHGLFQASLHKMALDAKGIVVLVFSNLNHAFIWYMRSVRTSLRFLSLLNIILYYTQSGDSTVGYSVILYQTQATTIWFAIV